MNLSFSCLNFQTFNYLTGFSHRSEIYVKVIKKIDKFTNIVYITFQVTVVTLFTPKLLVCYWLYYKTDLGSDAFVQSIPMS